MTTLILLKLYAFFLPFFIWLFPKLGDKYLDKLFNKKFIYIDRCWISKSSEGVKFDITLSTNFEQEISLDAFNVRFENKKKSGIRGLGGVQKISSAYKVYDKDGMLIMEVEDSIYPDKAEAWFNGNAQILKCKLLQTISSKSVERFTIDWISSEDFTFFEFCEVHFQFILNDSILDSKVLINKNPLFKESKSTIILQS